MTSGGFDGGVLAVRVGCRDGRIMTLAIASRRPQVAKAFCGAPADGVVHAVPMLFALCGQAQGRAATLALAGARGADTVAFMDAAIAAESVREHLWRVLLDLPPLLGFGAQRELFVRGQQALASGDRPALLTLLQADFWRVLRASLVSLEPVGESGLAVLPALSARMSLDYWPQFDAEFARRPSFAGCAVETGAFARRPHAHAAGLALAARWQARVDEIHAWAEGSEQLGTAGTASACAYGPRRGRALVETARGLLMHDIQLDDVGKTVADYVIVAPTEWNFHPQGRLHDWLRGRPVADEAAVRRLVAQAVMALDPCVRWEVDVFEVAR